MKNLLRLIDCGQSYWMDDLTRSMIRSGQLAMRVREQGLRGITSNPAIFHKAISTSSDYDDQIERLAGTGCGVLEIYEALVIRDVQDACDVLHPVYLQSDGVDGYVSLEVSPYLAHDAEGTLQEACRLFAQVARPNCLIKIPGTAAGVPAIEECLVRGININVTLLFSIRSYEAVAEAYLRALERRTADRKPVSQPASVASFFLSRIDTLADRLLGHRVVQGHPGAAVRPEQLLGKTAVASAKLAYESYKTIFSGERWQRLAQLGARVQRPLWASTSTKDPLYPDLKYVEPLIGRSTVNTMPEHTISLFAAHGIVAPDTIEKGVEEARKHVEDLAAAGVDLDFMARQLVNEGVEKFIEPFDLLIQSIAARRAQFLADKAGRQTASPGTLKAEYGATLASLDARQFGRRLYARDPLLWTADPKQGAAISNRLGWLHSMCDFAGKVEEIVGFAGEIRDAGIQHIVLLGMGGSSLCPEVARETFGAVPGWPRLLVLDNTDPAAVLDVESQIAIQQTLFIVASKSGTTTETSSFYRYFYHRLEESGETAPGKHFVAITDPGTSLVEEARSKGFRRVFENPADIGGRYSALSYFGLLPMALAGIEIRRVLEHAVCMHQSCAAAVPAAANPGVCLGTLLGLSERRGRDKLTLSFSPSMRQFGAWAEQLLAESTGKEGRGLVPIIGEDLAKPEAYGNDRIFIHVDLKDEPDPRIEKKLKLLEEAGHPVARIAMMDKFALGAEFVRWEIATAAAGAVIGVNPFDEPNVSESKRNTSDLLREWKSSGTFQEGLPVIADDRFKIYGPESAPWLFEGNRESVQEFVAAFLRLARDSDYVALLPYFLSTPSRDKKLQDLRLAVRDQVHVATTVGYGPRYLHSTGQLHKGGPDRGIFILMTSVAARDLPIPGEDYGFAVLQRAQALGDFRSLGAKGKRVIRIHLGAAVDKGLRLLGEMLLFKGQATAPTSN
jgi:transaldolase/glucose-6-phosphate isomerase